MGAAPRVVMPRSVCVCTAPVHERKFQEHCPEPHASALLHTDAHARTYAGLHALAASRGACVTRCDLLRRASPPSVQAWAEARALSSPAQKRSRALRGRQICPLFAAWPGDRPCARRSPIPTSNSDSSRLPVGYAPLSLQPCSVVFDKELSSVGAGAPLRHARRI